MMDVQKPVETKVDIEPNEKAEKLCNDINIKTKEEGPDKVRDKDLNDVKITNKVVTSAKHDDVRKMDSLRSTASNDSVLTDRSTDSVVEVHCSGDDKSDQQALIKHEKVVAKDSLQVNEHTPLKKELSATSTETRFSSDNEGKIERSPRRKSRRRSHHDGHHHHRSPRHRASERRKSRSSDRRGMSEDGESTHSLTRRQSTAHGRKTSVRRQSHAPVDKRVSVSAESRKGSTSQQQQQEYQRRKSHMSGPYMSPGLARAYQRPGGEILIASFIIILGLVALIVFFSTGQQVWMVVGCTSLGLGGMFMVLGLCWYCAKHKDDKENEATKSDSNMGTQKDLTRFADNSTPGNSPLPHRSERKSPGPHRHERKSPGSIRRQSPGVHRKSDRSPLPQRV